MGMQSVHVKHVEGLKADLLQMLHERQVAYATDTKELIYRDAFGEFHAFKDVGVVIEGGIMVYPQGRRQ